MSRLVLEMDLRGLPRTIGKMQFSHALAAVAEMHCVQAASVKHEPDMCCHALGAWHELVS